MKATKSEIAFDVVRHILLIIFCLLIIMPFMHIISVSLSDKEQILKLNVGLLPKGFNLGAYKVILMQNIFLSSLVNSVFVTATITLFSLLFNIMCAYAFTKEFYGKRVLTYVLVIPMYFSGGLIPYYLLISKYLGMYNTYFAIIVPFLFNIFYIIVLRSQVQSIPVSLTEAAKIDGAREHQVLFHIVIPSVMSSIAAIGMFIALTSWNAWFNVMIFTNKKGLWTLQYFLRTMIYDKSLSQSTASMKVSNMAGGQLAPENFQMAAIILVALPVVIIYPFIQKYFVKGILVGAVKE